jgi:uracil-DNA glycosylase family 4
VSESYCPSCTEKVIKPYGYTNSEILIIGDAPGKHELKSGRPFSGPTGNVFRQELKRVGLNIYNCRLTNLWLHPPNKARNKEEKLRSLNCLDAGKNVCLEEAKGRDAILLVGADTVMFFTGYKVSDVSGLQVDVEMFSAPIVYAMVQPATVFYEKGVGEIRFALESFTDKLREEEII